jgi:hypothetical protein
MTKFTPFLLVLVIVVVVLRGGSDDKTDSSAPKAAASHTEPASSPKTCAVNGLGNKLCGDDLAAYCDVIARDYVRTNHDGSQTFGVGMPGDTASTCRSAGWTPKTVPFR